MNVCGIFVLLPLKQTQGTTQSTPKRVTSCVNKPIRSLCRSWRVRISSKHLLWLCLLQFLPSILSSLLVQPNLWFVFIAKLLWLSLLSSLNRLYDFSQIHRTMVVEESISTTLYSFFFFVFFLLRRKTKSSLPHLTSEMSSTVRKCDTNSCSTCTNLLYHAFKAKLPKNQQFIDNVKKK